MTQQLVSWTHLKAPSLKDELDNDEIDKLKDYIKPLMNSATERNTIKMITISSTLINFLIQEALIFRMIF